MLFLSDCRLGWLFNPHNAQLHGIVKNFFDLERKPLAAFAQTPPLDESQIVIVTDF